MSNMRQKEFVIGKYPKKVFVTVPPEIYDALQRHGMSKVDVLITNLLSDYFEKLENNEVDVDDRNRKKFRY